jgi:hypothetical protein
MIANLSNKVILVVALVAGLLWTLTLALAFGLLAVTDDATLWLNQLLQIDPLWAQRLAGAGTWIAEFGGWVVLVIWALGVLALVLAAWFARRLAQYFSGTRREGELT